MGAMLPFLLRAGGRNCVSSTSVPLSAAAVQADFPGKENPHLVFVVICFVWGGAATPADRLLPLRIKDSGGPGRRPGRCSPQPLRAPEGVCQPRTGPTRLSLAKPPGEAALGGRSLGTVLQHDLG